MLWRRPRRPGGRRSHVSGRGRGLPLESAGTAHAAFRPLDPTLIAQCFYPIGRRPVARSAIVLRLALREGRPISRARLLFYPAIRVDSPTSPAVACSVRRQLSLHVGRRESRYESERAALHGHRVIAAPPLVFKTTREVTGARAHGSPILSHAVLAYGWSTCPFFRNHYFAHVCPTQSPAYSPSSPGSHPAHHQAFKFATRLVFELFRSLLCFPHSL